MTANIARTNRAPNGYRIKPFGDGTYHAYLRDGSCLDCIGEFLTRTEAIKACEADAIEAQKSYYEELANRA